LRKATTGCRNSPSVCLYACKNSNPFGRIFVKFDTGDSDMYMSYGWGSTGENVTSERKNLLQSLETFHTYMHSTHTHTHTHIHTCIHTYIHYCIRVYRLHTYVCINLHLYMHDYIHTHTYIVTYTDYIHTCIHTYIITYEYIDYIHMYA